MRLLKLLEEIKAEVSAIRQTMKDKANEKKMQNVTHKRCRNCGRVLPVEKFAVCVKSPDGRYDYCYECHDAYIKNKCKEVNK